jgi:hypothetical protein
MGYNGRNEGIEVRHEACCCWWLVGVPGKKCGASHHMGF